MYLKISENPRETTHYMGVCDISCQVNKQVARGVEWFKSPLIFGLKHKIYVDLFIGSKRPSASPIPNLNIFLLTVLRVYYCIFVLFPYTSS